ncbi:hypothetical protein LY78DRAFT_368002 [Colletotrichum sublineola]|nr:hypothetical protein LY78DRAFT_368002 [Colletotrichum sublineola]
MRLATRPFLLARRINQPRGRYATSPLPSSYPVDNPRDAMKPQPRWKGKGRDVWASNHKPHRRGRVNHQQFLIDDNPWTAMSILIRGAQPSSRKTSPRLRSRMHVPCLEDNALITPCFRCRPQLNCSCRPEGRWTLHRLALAKTSIARICLLIIALFQRGERGRQGQGASVSVGGGGLRQTHHTSSTSSRPRA